MLDRFSGTVEVEVVSPGNNLYLTVAFDGIEMFVIPAEKNEGIYLGKRDFLIQCFQETMGRGAAETRGRSGVDIPGEAGIKYTKGSENLFPGLLEPLRTSEPAGALNESKEKDQFAGTSRT